MLRRRVQCIDCGFVQSHFRTTADALELPLDYRHDRNRLEGVASVSCLRSAFNLQASEIARAREIRGSDDYETCVVEARLQILKKARACAYWFRHRPGFSPKEHLYLQEQERTEKSNRLWLVAATLLGTILGGLLAILAQAVA